MAGRPDGGLSLSRTLIFTKKLPELLNEKAFPSFAGLLDFSATGSLPNPREVPFVRIIGQYNHVCEPNGASHGCLRFRTLTDD